jgi:hypothetical protein
MLITRITARNTLMMFEFIHFRLPATVVSAPCAAFFSGQAQSSALNSMVLDSYLFPLM